ncbi:MAG: accessory factor UbiK family protein [Gammaproteobacteria bacterium]
MLEKRIIDDLAGKLADAVPQGAKTLQQDLENNFRGLLQHALGKLDLVTREEFDIQTKVLERTRGKLSQLEQELQKLTQDVESGKD